MGELAKLERPPRVAVYGLGAIGGLLAGRLADAGVAVSGVARGPTLEAVRRDGLRVVEPDGSWIGPRFPVAADPEELGMHDVVIIAVKTTGLGTVARDIGPLLGPRTVVVSAMNGVPWWFFEGLDGVPERDAVPALDPHGIGALIPADRVVGAVVHLSAACPAPGLVQRTAGDQLIVGRPTATSQPDPLTEQIAALLESASLEVTRSARIQRDVWFKLWGNMTMNPLSAITGATLSELVDEPAVRRFATECMREAAEVGARMGLAIDIDPEDRHRVTRRLGAVRTSMLQDVEAGRPLELDALVTVVTEIAAAYAIPTPNIELLLGLAVLHARSRGLHPGAAGSRQPADPS